MVEVRPDDHRLVGDRAGPLQDPDDVLGLDGRLLDGHRRIHRQTFQRARRRIGGVAADDLRFEILQGRLAGRLQQLIDIVAAGHHERGGRVTLATGRGEEQEFVLVVAEPGPVVDQQDQGRAVAIGVDRLVLEGRVARIAGEGAGFPFVSRRVAEHDDRLALDVDPFVIVVGDRLVVRVGGDPVAGEDDRRVVQFAAAADAQRHEVAPEPAVDRLAVFGLGRNRLRAAELRGAVDREALEVVGGGPGRLQADLPEAGGDPVGRPLDPLGPRRPAPLGVVGQEFQVSPEPRDGRVRGGVGRGRGDGQEDQGSRPDGGLQEVAQESLEHRRHRPDPRTSFVLPAPFDPGRSDCRGPASWPSSRSLANERCPTGSGL